MLVDKFFDLTVVICFLNSSSTLLNSLVALYRVTNEFNRVANEFNRAASDFNRAGNEFNRVILNTKFFIPHLLCASKPPPLDKLKHCAI